MDTKSFSQWSQIKSGSYYNQKLIELPLSFTTVYTGTSSALNGGTHWNDHCSIGALTISSYKAIGGFNDDGAQEVLCGFIFIGK